MAWEPRVRARPRRVGTPRRWPAPASAQACGHLGATRPRNRLGARGLGPRRATHAAALARLALALGPGRDVRPLAEHRQRRDGAARVGLDADHGHGLRFGVDAPARRFGALRGIGRTRLGLLRRGRLRPASAASARPWAPLSAACVPSTARHPSWDAAAVGQPDRARRPGREGRPSPTSRKSVSMPSQWFLAGTVHQSPIN